MQKILIVEDDIDIQDILKNHLIDAGYEVAVASDGVTGIAMFDDTIDLVLLDIMLPKIDGYGVCEVISNRAEFEALVKKNLAMQQTNQTKKQQKRIPQITTRLEQIDKVLNKLYEDNALGAISQDRYEQMSQKYSEEYYTLKAELATLQEQLSAYENAGGRAQKFLKLTERHAAFTDLTPAILISG